MENSNVKATAVFNEEAYVHLQQVLDMWGFTDVELESMGSHQRKNILELLEQDIYNGIKTLDKEPSLFGRGLATVQHMALIYEAMRELYQLVEWLEHMLPVSIWLDRSPTVHLEEIWVDIRVVGTPWSDKFIVWMREYIRDQMEHPQYAEHSFEEGDIFRFEEKSTSYYGEVSVADLWAHLPKEEAPEPVDLVRDYGLWVGLTLVDNDEADITPASYIAESLEHTDVITKDNARAFLMEFYVYKRVEEIMHDLFEVE